MTIEGQEVETGIQGQGQSLDTIQGHSHGVDTMITGVTTRRDQEVKIEIIHMRLQEAYLFITCRTFL